MIELVDGFWVDPWSVTVIKAIDDESCVLFVTGEDALGGHVLEYPADQVAQAVIDAKDGEDESEDDDDSDQDEE